MKWIEDLPADFTQDFLFTVTGVDDPDAWLIQNLVLGTRDWASSVTLTRDEILSEPLIRESILSEDLGDGAISWAFRRAHVLNTDLTTSSCCEVGHVIRRVSFESQKLTAVPDLSGFSGLISLDLTWCDALRDLSGISKLTNLRSLNLSNCKLLDLSSLPILPNLTALSLRRFYGRADLTDLSKLSGLTWLDLSGRQIQHLSGLSTLTNLSSLVLNDCKSLKDLSALSELTRLIRVDFGGCESLQDLSPLSGLTRLKSLSLSGCQSLNNLSGLSGLTSLDVLDLSGCHKLRDLSGLSSLTSLTSLDLSGCHKLRDVSGLSSLTSLTSLSLSRCQSVSELSSISDLTRLTSLNLNGCRALTDVSVLSNHKRLTSLDLSDCRGVQDISVLSDLTELNVLRLGYCEFITDTDFFTKLNRLAILDLRYCRSLRDLSGLSSCTSLTDLDFSECIELKDLTPLTNLVQLSSLFLFNCPLVDHEKSRKALAGLDMLKHLDGISEPWQTAILWNAARKRGDVKRLAELINEIFKLLDSEMSTTQLRMDFIEGLAIAPCSDEQMERVHGLPWSREEWARLLVVTDNRLDPVGAGKKFGVNEDADGRRFLTFQTEHTFFYEELSEKRAVNLSTNGRIGIRDALKGYILAVADGACWGGTLELIQQAFDYAAEELTKQGVEPHPSWDETLVDLLMALKRLGLDEKHDRLLRVATDANRQAFNQQMRIQAAETELDQGRWGKALEYMQDIPPSVETRLMNRIIPMLVDEEVPDAVLQWMRSDSDSDPLSWQIKIGSHNRRIREQLFWIHAHNRTKFSTLVSELIQAFPEDPWVLALHAECVPNATRSPSGLLESLRSESLSAILGPMVSQQLNSLIDGKTEAEMHRLAVALLLEHFGAVTPQFRETILNALQSPNLAS